MNSELCICIYNKGKPYENVHLPRFCVVNRKRCCCRNPHKHRLKVASKKFQVLGLIKNQKVIFTLKIHMCGFQSYGDIGIYFFYNFKMFLALVNILHFLSYYVSAFLRRYLRKIFNWLPSSVCKNRLRANYHFYLKQPQPQ